MRARNHHHALALAGHARSSRAFLERALTRPVPCVQSSPVKAFRASNQQRSAGQAAAAATAPGGRDTTRGAAEVAAAFRGGRAETPRGGRVLDEMGLTAEAGWKAVGDDEDGSGHGGGERALGCGCREGRRAVAAWR